MRTFTALKNGDPYQKIIEIEKVHNTPRIDYLYTDTEEYTPEGSTDPEAITSTNPVNLFYGKKDQKFYFDYSDKAVGLMEYLKNKGKISSYEEVI